MEQNEIDALGAYIARNAVRVPTTPPEEPRMPSRSLDEVRAAIIAEFDAEFCGTLSGIDFAQKVLTRIKERR